MFCPNCGKEISDTAKVCGYCGQPQKKHAKRQVNKPRPPEVNTRSKPSSLQQLRKVPVWIWGVGALIALSLLVWLISSFGATEGNSIAGKWIAIDLDGSNMQLNIRKTGDGVYKLERYDEMATSCEGKSATGVSNGYEDSPNTILATGSFSCENGKNLGVYTVAFHYESAADRIREETPDSGVFIFWERAE